VIDSLYLSGWEYNRLLADDPLAPRNSAIPSSILWSGAHQLWMFKDVYVTREAWDNELYATEELGWIMGDVLSFLQDEKIVTIVDWSEFDIDLRKKLKEAHRKIARDAKEAVPKAIREGASGELEAFKNLLLEPVLDRYKCVASSAPTSLETWVSARRDPPSQSAVSRLLHTIAEPLLPGVQMFGPPPSLASDAERAGELRVQAEVEKPMITDLIAGEGEFSGPQGFVPYVDALKRDRSAYEAVNQKMRAGWLARRDEILGLREAASDHLWEHLHGEWIPRTKEGDEKFVREELPRLIALALKARPFARYLDDSKLTPTIIGAVSLSALTLGVRAAATQGGLPAEYADAVAGTAATTAATTAKQHSSQVRQARDLAIFYQRSRRD
jgi:hypothetical protein